MSIPAAWPQTCPDCGGGARVITGVEYAGVYDGVLFWQCMRCGYPQHRFPEGDWRRELAEPYVRRRLLDPDVG